MSLGCIKTEYKTLFFAGEEPTRRAASLLVGEYDESAYSFIALCRLLGLEIIPHPTDDVTLDWKIEWSDSNSAVA